jgi:VanZ family protein
MVLGWTWRLWVFIATLMSALVPFHKTHFFDPSLGNVPVRLMGALVGTVVEGFIGGLIVWGIAAWIACATREETE